MGSNLSLPSERKWHASSRQGRKHNLKNYVEDDQSVTTTETTSTDCDTWDDRMEITKYSKVIVMSNNNNNEDDNDTDKECLTGLFGWIQGLLQTQRLLAVLTPAEIQRLLSMTPEERHHCLSLPFPVQKSLPSLETMPMPTNDNGAPSLSEYILRDTQLGAMAMPSSNDNFEGALSTALNQLLLQGEDEVAVLAVAPNTEPVSQIPPQAQLEVQHGGDDTHSARSADGGNRQSPPRLPSPMPPLSPVSTPKNELEENLSPDDDGLLQPPNASE